MRRLALMLGLALVLATVAVANTGPPMQVTGSEYCLTTSTLDGSIMIDPITTSPTTPTSLTIIMGGEGIPLTQSIEIFLAIHMDVGGETNSGYIDEQACFEHAAGDETDHTITEASARDAVMNLSFMDDMKGGSGKAAISVSGHDTSRARSPRLVIRT